MSNSSISPAASPLLQLLDFNSILSSRLKLGLTSCSASNSQSLACALSTTPQELLQLIPPPPGCLGGFQGPGSRPKRLQRRQNHPSHQDHPHPRQSLPPAELRPGAGLCWRPCSSGSKTSWPSPQSSAPNFPEFVFDYGAPGLFNKSHVGPSALVENLRDLRRPLLNRLGFRSCQAKNFSQELPHLIMGFPLRKPELQQLPQLDVAKFFGQILHRNVLHCVPGLAIQQRVDPRPLLLVLEVFHRLRLGPGAPPAQLSPSVVIFTLAHLPPPWREVVTGAVAPLPVLKPHTPFPERAAVLRGWQRTAAEAPTRLQLIHTWIFCISCMHSVYIYRHYI